MRRRGDVVLLQLDSQSGQLLRQAASRSSGPGGQHAQKTETRVEAVFDVEASATLTDAQKQRLLARAGPLVRAVAQDERSQWRNRETALERLPPPPGGGPPATPRGQ